MKNKEIMTVLAGLLLLTSACEKDGGLYGSGNEVPITFSMSSSGYDADDDELRGFEVREPETVVAPMGSDNLYLYATLKEDPAEEQDRAELRAQVSLTAGQKVRIAAYKGSTQQGTTITYTYNGSTLTPDGSTPLSVTPDGSTYTFVAYSYYGARTTAPVESGITPDKDLVWGSKSQAVTSDASTHTVSLNMTHRFSRVRVRINASTHASAITNIGTVTVTGGKTANLTVQTGAVAPTSTNASQNVNFPSSTSATRTSDYVVYYRDVTGVNISTITMTTTASGSKTFTNLSPTFSKSLTMGRSYTLEMGVKRITFSGNIVRQSNIMGVSVSTSKAQGLLFKWGSLVGISPVDGTSAAQVGNVIIHVPSGSTWSSTTISASTWGSYAAIPSSGSYGGDICTKVSGGWRIPTVAEFSSILSLNYELLNEGGGSTVGLDFGAGTLSMGYMYGGICLFPLSGYRGTDGVLTGVNSVGRYWNSTSGGYMNLPSGNATGSDQYAYPVRCVKEE
jgi:hypothetical protein